MMTNKNYPLGITDISQRKLPSNTKRELLNIATLDKSQEKQFIKDIEQAVAVFHATRERLKENSSTQAAKSNRIRLLHSMKELKAQISKIDGYNHHHLIKHLGNDWNTLSDLLEQGIAAIAISNDEFDEELSGRGQSPAHSKYELARDIAKILNKYGIRLTQSRPSNNNTDSITGGLYWRCTNVVFESVNLNISDLRQYLRFGKKNIS